MDMFRRFHVMVGGQVILATDNRQRAMSKAAEAVAGGKTAVRVRERQREGRRNVAARMIYPAVGKWSLE